MYHGAHMHCTLLIPDLLAPSELGAGLYAADCAWPCAGVAMLGARRGTAGQHSAARASKNGCASRFGVTRQQVDLPLAAH